MLEPFIRVLNSELVKQTKLTVLDQALPADRALINESAFEYVRRTTGGPIPLDDLLPSIVSEISPRLAALDGKISDPVRDFSVALNAKQEITSIAANLEVILAEISGDLVFNPGFRGCGYLSPCVGDVLVGDCLVEVKAGRRTFRIEDVRQLLTYALLNHASKNYVIRRVALVNPREGTYSLLPLEVLTHRIAAASPDEFFERCLFRVSGGSISR